jgi:hypothetical protein
MASLPFELKGKTVYVAGHRGMVGSALVRRLAAENVELLTASRSEAGLRDQAAVNAWVAANHVGAVTSPLQIGITAYGIPPDGVPSRDSYPVGTRERRLFDRDQRSVLYVPVTMGSIESRWLNFKVSAFLTRAGYHHLGLRRSRSAGFSRNKRPLARGKPPRGLWPMRNSIPRNRRAWHRNPTQPRSHRLWSLTG